MENHQMKLSFHNVSTEGIAAGNFYHSSFGVFSFVSLAFWTLLIPFQDLVFLTHFLNSICSGQMQRTYDQEQLSAEDVNLSTLGKIIPLFLKCSRSQSTGSGDLGLQVHRPSMCFFCFWSLYQKATDRSCEKWKVWSVLFSVGFMSLLTVIFPWSSFVDSIKFGSSCPTSWPRSELRRSFRKMSQLVRVAEGEGENDTLGVSESDHFCSWCEVKEEVFLSIILSQWHTTYEVLNRAKKVETWREYMYILNFCLWAKTNWRESATCFMSWWNLKWTFQNSQAKQGCFNWQSFTMWHSYFSLWVRSTCASFDENPHES